MYTSHHDPKHCFEETRDGTLEVRVRGDSLPRDLFGRLYIVFAILRQLALVVWILQYERDTYDIIVVDQLSACIPLLRWLGRAKVNLMSSKEEHGKEKLTFFNLKDFILLSFSG